jgi:hypothetical protein
LKHLLLDLREIWVVSEVVIGVFLGIVIFDNQHLIRFARKHKYLTNIFRSVSSFSFLVINRASFAQSMIPSANTFVRINIGMLSFLYDGTHAFLGPE